MPENSSIIKKILIFFLATTLLISCLDNEQVSSPFHVNTEFNTEELIIDFNILRSALEEAHPGIYRYTTKEKFDMLFDSLQVEIKYKMTELEFFRFISPIIAQIKCGHTGISVSSGYRQYMTEAPKFFPLQLKFISDKAYVLKSLHLTELIPPGSEIISLNEKTISEITKVIFEMISSDGNIQTAKYRRLDEEFSRLYFQCISPLDSFKIKYISPGDNLPVSDVLSAIDWQEIWKYKSSYMARQKELS